MNNQGRFDNACRTGNIKLTKELINLDNVDPSARNNYAIRWASENGHYNIVRLLLNDPRVDPSDADNWAIFWASYYGHYNIVRLLLTDPRVDFLMKDEYDKSALDYSIEKNHKKIELYFRRITFCRGLEKLNTLDMGPYLTWYMSKFTNNSGIELTIKYDNNDQPYIAMKS